MEHMAGAVEVNSSVSEDTGLAAQTEIVAEQPEAPTAEPAAEATRSAQGDVPDTRTEGTDDPVPDGDPTIMAQERHSPERATPGTDPSLMRVATFRVIKNEATVVLSRTRSTRRRPSPSLFGRAPVASGRGLPSLQRTRGLKQGSKSLAFPRRCPSIGAVWTS